MKRYAISEIPANKEVHCLLVIREKELRVARNGKPYINLRLADKTGQITGRVWENAEAIFATLPENAVVAVSARSELYRDQMQLNIEDIRIVPRSEINPRDFLPQCPLGVDRLWEELHEIIATVKRKSLRCLLTHVFSDPEIASKFKQAPAAKSVHHAYLGGLLEHSVSVAKLVNHLSSHYENLHLDRDLLVTAAILHDIGKIDEFIYELTIDYSDEGRLIGHIILGWEIVGEKIKRIERFSEREAILLKHLILSHHGEAEFGTVRLPMTREAMLLHLADDLDAKMNSLIQILGSESSGDDLWTTYQPLYRRQFFRGWSGDDRNLSGIVTEVSRCKQLSLWPSDPAGAEEDV